MLLTQSTRDSGSAKRRNLDWTGRLPYSFLNHSSMIGSQCTSLRCCLVKIIREVLAVTCSFPAHRMVGILP